MFLLLFQETYNSTLHPISQLLSFSMKSPISFSGSRNHESRPTTSTPDRPSYSPSSRSAHTASSVARKSKESIAIVARSVAGVFVDCFTPPENTHTDSKKSKLASPVESKAPPRFSRAGSNRSSSTYNSTKHEGEARNAELTMDEIHKATRNFSPAFKIGQGGFGTVYKGILSNGTTVAIKRAKKSLYDTHLGAEFQSEIQTLAQVEHLNLVRLYGFLVHEDERIVVVEYVPNGSLREHLDCVRGNVLDLAARLDIAIDVAHAVTYLHMYTDHPIIHRDIKSSNILLNENLRAKVADFGFARLGADSDATHVSTQVKGTAGYLDPEYLRTYQLTEKSDVYSFGVLLVELVTGRRPIEPKREPKERLTAKWAMKKFTDGDAISILDPKLDSTAPANNLAIEKILELALRCLAHHRQNRPSMRKCAEILWSIRKYYRELSGSGSDHQLLSLQYSQSSGSVRE